MNNSGIRYLDGNSHSTGSFHTAGAAAGAVKTAFRRTPTRGAYVTQHSTTAALRAEVAKLHERVALLESYFETVEELDFGVALDRARDIFSRHKGPLYPTDLADMLGTSISQAVELCETLELEGAVEGKTAS